MARTARTKSRRRPRPHAIHKPNGVLHPRVQAVGPEHFGILSVDCAKARSKIMLADFYGRTLIPPTVVEHNQAGLEGAARLLHEALQRYHIKDHIVAVERTGCYHGPLQRAFAQAGSEVRIVHPFATKQFRLPADPGNKTDDTDLSAIFRAAVNGFGLLEHEPDPLFVRLQPLARRRRDLVRKKVTVQQQMHEHLQSFMPGYAHCFDDVFESEIALWAARSFDSAAAIVAIGLPGLVGQLRQAGLRMHTPTLEKILAWARQAPTPQMTYRHPCSQQRDHVIQKLIKFSLEHNIDSGQLLRNLDAAAAQIPRSAYREEAAPLAEELARVQQQRGAGPHRLGEILPAVLAKLGVGTVNSSVSGESDPT